ncbi:hypothetical protein E3U23_02640 [Erythrobacter litoralis]|uniref:LuxR C-terminal-related transcriptional regulator n=1 Tax=Erythrobacter litoralis TaxID=39960 RepID=UPI002435ABE7|nr:LuxR C-terminal-related transcriptional regulator [Erythrobacter litoralis]MDG6078091.1 hypothetical protein [Erythrobacter litoralis]
MSDAPDIDAVYRGLTEKQTETLDMVGEGLTHKEIAAKLDISASAATQRIETLRAKFGGVTKARLARLHRARCEKATCKTVTGKKSHLFASPAKGPLGTRHDDSFNMSLSDSAPVFRRDIPWSEMREPRVVPEVLDGKHASTFRWAAVVIIAAGLLVLVLVMLAVSQAIGSLR